MNHALACCNNNKVMLRRATATCLLNR